MANFVPCHCDLIASGPSLSQSFSIAHVIVDSISYISVKKTTETGQYWWSSGSAKFDDSTASFEAITCRALARSISVHLLQIMHFIVAYETIHYRAKQDADWTSLWCSILVVMPRCLHDGTCHGCVWCGVAYRIFLRANLPARWNFWDKR